MATAGSVAATAGPCPLCHFRNTLFFHRDQRRDYWRCPCCELVFVPAVYWLGAEAEKAVYDQHQNHPDDSGYRAFLSRLAEPLLACLQPGQCGLDFGSGPGPTLSVMLAERGMQVHCFDPFYAPCPGLLEQTYDFITATEVVEHLQRPGEELARLWSLLRPGGVMGLMTKRLSNPAAFPHWHYILDPTHICFFSAASFSWLAAEWGAELLLPAADVTLLKKPGP